MTVPGGDGATDVEVNGAEMDDLLKTLKVGDVVSLDTYARSNRYLRGTVCKRTPKQIHVQCGRVLYKYSASDGRPIGGRGPWHMRPDIGPWSDEIEAARRRERLAYELSLVRWSEYSLPVLEAVYQLVAKEKQS